MPKASRRSYSDREKACVTIGKHRPANQNHSQIDATTLLRVWFLPPLGLPWKERGAAGATLEALPQEGLVAWELFWLPAVM